jgi:putative tryptophan/tyrosine transport system substrate-binding protein
MQRRQLIALLGGAVTWPLAARAQQDQRMRRIGVLSALAEDDPESVARRPAFEQALKALGWTNGSNLQIDYRWAAGDAERISKLAAEIIALAPDVILLSGSSVVAPMMQATSTIPIVFVQVVDPVGSGFVQSLARPGGNITGFTQFEYSLAGKWVELLKQIAPHVTRAAVIRDPRLGYGIGQFAVVQAIAPSLGMELSPINAPDVSEIERGIAAFARSPNGGLVVTTGGTGFHRNEIIALAAKHRLPAVYPYSYFVRGGGLISYGPDTIDQYRRAADYIDRIFKGERPADLPVQTPTKYNLAINLKTAQSLGLAVPHAMLTRADEVIE